MRNKVFLVAIVLVLLLTTTLHAHAQSDATGVFVNGQEVTYRQLNVLEYYYGELAPGYYRLDQDGTLTYLGEHPTSKPAAQAHDDALQRAKRDLVGRKVLFSYRKGGPIYGTYYFWYVNFCSQTGYWLVAESNRQTILDNEENHSWQDAGTWDVVYRNGVLVTRLESSSGGVTEFPLNDAASVRVTVQGDAVCD